VRGGQLEALVGQEPRGEAAAHYFIEGQVFDLSPLLLLPSTRGQGDEGAATVHFDQRVVGVLD
jgi:hypothetical protein